MTGLSPTLALLIAALLFGVVAVGWLELARQIATTRGRIRSRKTAVRVRGETTEDL